jgi:cytochrome c-type biogenesis protein CcmH
MGGPDAKAMADAAAMTDEQRQAMVRGMVANLAAKQAADPENLDGWLKLGRAYAVLHEPQKAAEAYDKAARLRPGDVSIPLQEVRALLSDQAPTDKLPDRVIDLLRQVEARDPEQPLVLWYLGMAAAQDAHRDEARRYWSKLLTKVPAGGDDARMIQSAIDALDKV